MPLYIVDTQTDVRVVKRAPAAPLFITQDNHKLILPELPDSSELSDSITFMVLKDSVCVYSVSWTKSYSVVYLPTSLVGDFEVRIYVDTYYYYGYITLDAFEAKVDENGVPTETANWENITVLGSNTPLEVILDNLMKLNVVEYDSKLPYDEIQYLNDEDKERYIKNWEETHANRRIGLLNDELRAMFPQLVDENYGINVGGLNVVAFFPILISCIQELKTQLDARTEKLVDVMMSRATGPLAVNAARAAIGNTLLTVAASSVNEPTRVRYLLTDDATNAYLAITDMSGRTMKKIPVSPSDTDVSIDSGILGEGIFLCTLCVNGNSVGTKRLVKTKK